MSGILTLFGEELQPEQINAVGKSRAPKKEKKEPAKKTAKAKEKEEQPAPPQPQPAPVAAAPPKKVKKPTATKKKEEVKKDILQGWVPDKQYYSIGEVATLFEVNTSHIRFWTKEFDMRVRTTRKGDRLYAPDQIKELRAIYHLVKERGFTISGAKSKLKESKKSTGETLDLKSSLLQLRNKLLTMRNKLA